MIRRVSNPLTAPLLSPEASMDALSELMPILDWLAQADLLQHHGLHRQAANCMTEALLAFRALPRNALALDAFAVWRDRHSFRAEALGVCTTTTTIDVEPIEHGERP